ncbi:MAG: hypothetical protein MRQ09_06605 [Candidatus Midichloria sp.]|nr:hypothetical protein [Candidatus Midichloria sp.]
MVADSAGSPQFAGFPRRYPDFDPDDNSGYGGGGNSFEDNQNNRTEAWGKMLSCLVLKILLRFTNRFTL